MSLPEDPLQPISWTQIEELLERLLLEVPNSLTVRGMLQTTLKWKKTGASQQIRVYTTSDDFERAAIVCIHKTTSLPNYRITIYCSKEDTSALRNALLETKRINWKSLESTVYFTPFNENLLPIVQECLSHHNYEMIEVAKNEPKVLKQAYKWKTAYQRTSYNFSCPPEIELAPLHLDAVELIKSNWFIIPGAADYISTLIKHNPSLGIYSKSTGELCAWVLFSEFGALAMLHTEEKHRRKGYSQLLVKAMCELLLPHELIVGAVVTEGNMPPTKLFEALQFQSTQNVILVVQAQKLQ